MTFKRLWAKQTRPKEPLYIMYVACPPNSHTDWNDGEHRWERPHPVSGFVNSCISVLFFIKETLHSFKLALCILLFSKGLCHIWCERQSLWKRLQLFDFSSHTHGLRLHLCMKAVTCLQSHNPQVMFNITLCSYSTDRNSASFQSLHWIILYSRKAPVKQ